MLATRSIQTLVGKDKPFDWSARNQVFSNDLGDILRLDVPVPDSLGIDDHGRPVFALIEAAGLVGSNPRTETGRLDLILEQPLQFAFAICGTGRPCRPGLAMVSADKHMPLKLWQA